MTGLFSGPALFLQITSFWEPAALPFNLGGEEFILIGLIVAILAGPGIVALAAVLLILRFRRGTNRPPLPLPPLRGSGGPHDSPLTDESRRSTI